MKIGVHGAITAEIARDIAGRELGKIAGGGDPAEDRRQSKSNEAARRAVPTVAELCDRYLIEWAEVKKRASSVEDDRSMIEKIVKPALGGKRVPEVEQNDIAALHRKMKATPFRANRVLALLSKMFSLATGQWKLRPDNPVRGLGRYDEPPRERYLTPAELGRLAAALAAHRNQETADAIRLLLLTGARRGEVLSMTWEQVDQNPGTWIKPSAHTKQKRVHRAPLSPGALAILDRRREQRAEGEVYVFPGRGSGERPIAELKSTWKAVTKAAQISGVRPNDLRHSYASLLVNTGHSLPLIGALLGHTQVKTTQRYAHLADDPLREATGRVDAMLAAIGTGKSADVVPLAKRS
jgi:integrase